MRRRTATALAVIALLPLAACSGPATHDQTSYTIDQPVTALKVDARGAGVDITAADGPPTVTEKHTYSDGAPTTAHAVSGTTLQLTESGCGNDDARCETEFVIRMPRTMSAEITAQAGAVKVHGLAGNVHVTTQAGAFEGTALAADEVIIRTQAGAASLAFTRAPTLVRTTTELGAVELSVPGTEKYAVSAHTGTGATEVSVDQDAASTHRIEVSTDVGAIHVEKVS